MILLRTACMLRLHPLSETLQLQSVWLKKIVSLKDSAFESKCRVKETVPECVMIGLFCCLESIEMKNGKNDLGR